MVLCWKIRSTWVIILPPLSLHGAHVFSLLLLSKGYRGAGRGEKKREDPKLFFSLIRVSSEQMNSDLPALKKFPPCGLCWEWPQHCFLSLVLIFSISTTSVTKLLVISNYRSFWHDKKPTQPSENSRQEFLLNVNTAENLSLKISVKT